MTDGIEYKVWCPVCEEYAYLKGRDAAEQLAENHDENHHDGESQTFLLSSMEAGR